MYKSFDEFKKSTKHIHGVLVNAGAKIKLSVYREEIASSLGFKDINSFKAELDKKRAKCYVLVFNFGGSVEELHTFKHTHVGKVAMYELFQNMILNDMDLDTIEDGSEDEKTLFAEAMESDYYESGKLFINCYEKAYND